MSEAVSCLCLFKACANSNFGLAFCQNEFDAYRQNFTLFTDICATGKDNPAGARSFAQID